MTMRPSDPSDRPRAVQAENVNLKATTVATLIVTAVGLLATSLITAGSAWNRLSVIEGRYVELERRLVEAERVNLTIRDLQAGQAALRVGLDATGTEVSSVMKKQKNQGTLVLMMCMSVDWQRRTGGSCKLAEAE